MNYRWDSVRISYSRCFFIRMSVDKVYHINSRVQSNGCHLCSLDMARSCLNPSFCQAAISSTPLLEQQNGRRFQPYDWTGHVKIQGPWVTGCFQTAWFQSIARIIYNWCNLHGIFGVAQKIRHLLSVPTHRMIGQVWSRVSYGNHPFSVVPSFDPPYFASPAKQPYSATLHLFQIQNGWHFFITCTFPQKEVCESNHRW